jgi:hypothetical protein
MKETIIKVKELVKNYGNFQAVKGSVLMCRRRIFGLLGQMAPEINNLNN